ncbi:MAG: RNA methyltransferase [Chloroflexi bacterium]|nr:RNA methyltransferase [Chloroflexota bacterium]
MEDPQTDLQIYWLDQDQTILVADFGAELTVDKVLEGMDAIAEALKASDRLVHFIGDLSHTYVDPQVSSKVLGNATTLVQHPFWSHPNMGFTMVMLGQTFLERTTNIFSKLFQKLYTVDTVDEAIALIEERTGQRVRII